MAELKFTYIRDLTPNMKNINVQFIVLDVGPPRRTKDGNDVRTIRIADKSGSVNLAVWNEAGACLQGGDICRLINGFTNVHKSALSVTCGKMGELQKISEFCMTFSETPFLSTPNPEFAKLAGDPPPKYGSPGLDANSSVGGNTVSASGNGGSGHSPTTVLAKNAAGRAPPFQQQSPVLGLAKMAGAFNQFS